MRLLKTSTFYILRVLIVALSGLTLACHIAQIVLLLQIENTGNWWPHYIPYTFYYVGPLVSILSINALFILGYCTRSLIVDRVVSILNTALLIAIVVYNTMKSGTIPWLGDAATGFTSDIKGWVPYCSSYSYSNTVIRCWMVNGTWLGCILVAFLWLLLSTCVFVLKTSDIYQKDDYDTHDFKEDVPMVERPDFVVVNSSFSQQRNISTVSVIDNTHIKDHLSQ